MFRLASSVTVVLLPAVLGACGDAVRPTDPQLESRTGTVANLVAERRIQMMDACDPESFNAVLGEGTCVRQGGITFARFLGLLEKHQKVGAWVFAPGKVNARVGQTLVAINNGGEAHTFTEVEEFGGGVVPELNELSGTPEPAPECLALAPEDFVPPGGTYREDVEEAGTERYMCCLHPWMRTVVTAK
jgi:plastocyanin